MFGVVRRENKLRPVLGLSRTQKKTSLSLQLEPQTGGRVTEVSKEKPCLPMRVLEGGRGPSGGGREEGSGYF